MHVWSLSLVAMSVMVLKLINYFNTVLVLQNTASISSFKLADRSCETSHIRFVYAKKFFSSENRLRFYLIT